MKKIFLYGDVLNYGMNVFMSGFTVLHSLIKNLGIDFQCIMGHGMHM